MAFSHKEQEIQERQDKEGTISLMKSNDLVLEKDWKLFRKRLPEWQERHMQSLLDEYAAIITGDGNPSAKFWKLKERLKKDVRHVGVQAEMSRSRMVLNLMCLLHEKAITMSDLDGFSDEVKAAMPPSFTVD